LTSDAKIKANRANARASTGPKTARGRARAARNAYRHGLSLPLYSDPIWSAEVKERAREIAGTDANANVRLWACHIAEAEIDLRRVRHARNQFLNGRLKDKYYDSRASEREKFSLILKILSNDPPEIPSESALCHYLTTSTLQGPEKLATILCQEIKQLRAMDRYERRAWSRLKIATREFDAARRQTTT
jgi:hypothetical protein